MPALPTKGVGFLRVSGSMRTMCLTMRCRKPLPSTSKQSWSGPAAHHVKARQRLVRVHARRAGVRKTA